MNRYGRSNTVKNYDCIRKAALWAGSLGVAQSIAWMALTITGIVAYNCIIKVDKDFTFGYLIESVFYNLYFRGNCRPPAYNQTMLYSVNTVLDSKQILIWDCVYLGVAVCWLLSSTTLFIYVKRDNAKLTSGVILTWVIFTFFICIMDLALGIIFGIDYGQFQNRAYAYNLDSANGAIDPNAAQLVAAMVASISMMFISFKGFVFWIINFGLLCYLFICGVRILRDKDGNDTLFMPRKDSDVTLATRPPIKAYDEDKTIVAAYTNDGFIVESTQSVGAIELNQDPITRAARMSTDASLQDRRFRNLDAFQQYPPPRYNNVPSNNNINNNKNRLVSTKEEEIITTKVAVGGGANGTGFPVPDYTPPMARASQNAILRNQRY